MPNAVNITNLAIILLSGWSALMVLVLNFSSGLQQQVDKALSFIGKKFKDLDLTNLYAPPLTLPSLPITSWVRLRSLTAAVSGILTGIENIGSRCG